MNLFYFYKYLNLTLLAIFGNTRLASSAALSRYTVSLYNATDKLTVLTNETFLSTVYHSETAWLVEFYASWCGHCQSYAKVYREIAVDTWAWQSVVRIGAINCYGGDNNVVCRQHNVRGYPTLLLIPPNAASDNKSKIITIPLSDAKEVEKELIKGLENLNRRNTTWPRFIPVNRITIEELYLSLPKTIKLLFIIAERRDDLTGRQIMLDFSKYHEQISVFRTTTDGKLWRTLHLNITDTPALFVVLRNRTLVRLDTKKNITHPIGNRNLFNHAIRSYIEEKNIIKNFNNEDLKEIISSKIALKKTQTKDKSIPNNITDEIRDTDTIYRKIHMQDHEIALAYMFRHEIPQIGDIQGDIFKALGQWLNVLIKYFPGREPVMNHMRFILSKINENTKGLSGNQFREIFDMEKTKAYFPEDRQQYQHCAGSLPHYRGYPCGLWILFHTLTVSQYQLAMKNSDPVDVYEVPSAIKDYIKYFFTCRKCSDNFMNETSGINHLNLNNKQEAILYLWKIHNHVNQRLSFDITEDPKHPKVQFPSKSLCQTCRSTDQKDYDLSKTISFLLNYYSKENIDQSPITNNFDPTDDRSDYVISKLDKIEFLSTGPGVLTRIFQRFSIYIFLGIFLLVIILRRRYCKTKGKRYTL